MQAWDTVDDSHILDWVESAVPTANQSPAVLRFLLAYAGPLRLLHEPGWRAYFEQSVDSAAVLSTIQAALQPLTVGVEPDRKTESAFEARLQSWTTAASRSAIGRPEPQPTAGSDSAVTATGPALVLGGDARMRQGGGGAALPLRPPVPGVVGAHRAPGAGSPHARSPSSGSASPVPLPIAGGLRPLVARSGSGSSSASSRSSGGVGGGSGAALASLGTLGDALPSGAGPGPGAAASALTPPAFPLGSVGSFGSIGSSFGSASSAGSGGSGDPFRTGTAAGASLTVPAHLRGTGTRLHPTARFLPAGSADLSGGGGGGGGALADLPALPLPPAAAGAATGATMADAAALWEASPAGPPPPPPPLPASSPPSAADQLREVVTAMERVRATLTSAPMSNAFLSKLQQATSDVLELVPSIQAGLGSGTQPLGEAEIRTIAFRVYPIIMTAYHYVVSMLIADEQGVRFCRPFGICAAFVRACLEKFLSEPALRVPAPDRQRFMRLATLLDEDKRRSAVTKKYTQLYAVDLTRRVAIAALTVELAAFLWRLPLEAGPLAIVPFAHLAAECLYNVRESKDIGLRPGDRLVDKRVAGVVTLWKPAAHFGFIRFGGDYTAYFHLSHLRSDVYPSQIAVGVRVLFTVVETAGSLQRHCFEARAVRPDPSAASTAAVGVPSSVLPAPDSVAAGGGSAGPGESAIAGRGFEQGGEGGF